ETYYGLLGVPRTATTAQIKSAYRRRVAQTHPDRAEGRVDEFRWVCAAWAVLRDPARRQEYDARLGLQPQTTSDPTTDGSRASNTGGQSSRASTATTGPPPRPQHRRQQAQEQTGETTAPPRPTPEPQEAPTAASGAASGPAA